ncbi:MAG TPA: hydroxyacid dehydrogenase [Spirochaetia bacterium]|nr:hydroxyacid dehydrogenase [Spirochaetia bacterium]
MEKMKVFVADSIAKEGMAEFARHPELEAVVKTGLPPAALASELGDSVGLVVRSATQASREVINAGRSLKVIGRAGAGVDNIDVKAASERGILVLNTPGGNAEAAGELAIAMMFALARELTRADASMKAGTWDKKSFSGCELLGKTLGLIGIGNVGSIVGTRALGLGMKVMAYDPFVSAEKTRSLGFLPAGFDETIGASDFLSIHAPKTAETKGILNATAFAKMKKGVSIINCARGGIVVEKDLLAALESGVVKGAGVDVYEKEPPDDWSLAKHPRVIATPHIGASTAEAQINVSVMIARQIAAYLVKGEVINAVNGVK